MCPRLHCADWRTAVPHALPARGSKLRSWPMASGFPRGFRIPSGSLFLVATGGGCNGWFSRSLSRHRLAPRLPASRHVSTGRFRMSARWKARRISFRNKSRTVRPPSQSEPVHKNLPLPACYRCSPMKAWDNGVAPAQTLGSNRFPLVWSASPGRQIPDGRPPSPAIHASSGRIPGLKFPVRSTRNNYNYACPTPCGVVRFVLSLPSFHPVLDSKKVSCWLSCPMGSLFKNPFSKKSISQLFSHEHNDMTTRRM